jgi:murein DD-endopeptidase MepM/ murein hydrolase activator NlpD
MLPVQANGVQWFGPTQRAYNIMSNGGDIYKYCGYYHCGLDLLADYGSPVISATYGKIISIDTRYEGPHNITVQYGGYEIKYGHTDGTATVAIGDYVIPGQPLTGVGNMAGSPGSGEIDHIHFEVRGPDGWNGNSINPVKLMKFELIADLQSVAANQTNQVTMGQYHSSFNPPEYLQSIGLENTFPFSLQRNYGNYFNGGK